MGRVATLRYMLSDYMEEDHDDRLYMQNTFLEGVFNIGLDYEGYIFQSWDDALEVVNQKVVNPLNPLRRSRQR